MRSPCVGCPMEWEEKSKCMSSCERIREYQKLLKPSGRQSNFMLPQDVFLNSPTAFSKSTPN